MKNTPQEEMRSPIHLTPKIKEIGIIDKKATELGISRTEVIVRLLAYIDKIK